MTHTRSIAVLVRAAFLFVLVLGFGLSGPAQAAELFRDSFESGDLSHTQDGFGWNGPSGGPATPGPR